MKNEEMMKSGSVWKAIASMAIPSAVIMILMIFYNIADMVFYRKDWGTTHRWRQFLWYLRYFPLCQPLP